MRGANGDFLPMWLGWNQYRRNLEHRHLKLNSTRIHYRDLRPGYFYRHFYQQLSCCRRRNISADRWNRYSRRESLHLCLERTGCLYEYGREFDDHRNLDGLCRGLYVYGD